MGIAGLRAKTEARPVANICFLTFSFSFEVQYKSTGQIESEEQASFIYQGIRRKKKKFLSALLTISSQYIEKVTFRSLQMADLGPQSQHIFYIKSINSGRIHLSSQQMWWRLLIFSSVTFPFITLELCLFPRRTRQMDIQRPNCPAFLSSGMVQIK